MTPPVMAQQSNQPFRKRSSSRTSWPNSASVPAEAVLHQTRHRERSRSPRRDWRDEKANFPEHQWKHTRPCWSDETGSSWRHETWARSYWGNATVETSKRETTTTCTVPGGRPHSNERVATPSSRWPSRHDSSPAEVACPAGHKPACAWHGPGNQKKVFPGPMMSQTRDTEAPDYHSWASHVGSVFTHHQEFVSYLMAALASARKKHNMIMYYKSGKKQVRDNPVRRLQRGRDPCL